MCSFEIYGREDSRAERVIGVQRREIVSHFLTWPQIPNPT